MPRERVVHPAHRQPVFLLHHYKDWLPILAPVPAAAPVRPLMSKYQHQLYDVRHDVSALAKEGIVAATGDPGAQVSWMREETSGAQKNVFKSHAEMMGWPRHITYEAPGHKSSVRKLTEIADGLRAGRIYFRRVPSAEVRRRERELGLSYVEARRARNDVEQRRPLRPLDTRSLLKRRWTGIKTRNEVTEQEDIEAAIWPDDAEVARARAEEVDEIEDWDD